MYVESRTQQRLDFQYPWEPCGRPTAIWSHHTSNMYRSQRKDTFGNAACSSDARTHSGVDGTVLAASPKVDGLRPETSPTYRTWGNDLQILFQGPFQSSRRHRHGGRGRRGLAETGQLRGLAGCHEGPIAGRIALPESSNRCSSQQSADGRENLCA